MAELATRDGMPPPADLPRGDCICTSLPDGHIRIDHADPRIMVSAELLAEAFVHPASGIGLSLPPDSENGTPFWTGALLKIAGVNRTVIYRILEYVPRIYGYIAEWPD